MLALLAMIYKKKKKRKPRSDLKKLNDHLDKLWKEIILLRDNNQCQRCGKKASRGSGNSIQAHHIYGRSNFRVRWNPTNGIALCGGCHTLTNHAAHKAPIDFINWLKQQRGEDWWYKLSEEANKEGGSRKWTIQEKKDLEIDLEWTLHKLQMKPMTTIK